MNPEDVPSVENMESSMFHDPFICENAPNEACKRSSDLASLYRPITTEKSSIGSLLTKSLAEGVEKDPNMGSLLYNAMVEGTVLTINEISPNEALTGPDATKWYEAFKTEFDAIMRTGTFKAMTEEALKALHNGELQVHHTRPILTIKRNGRERPLGTREGCERGRDRGRL